MTTRDLVKGPRVQLFSGGYFSFEHPETTPPTIEDIAQGLSNTCRYNGQCPEFYSVAEHSVIMSYMVDDEHAYDALMHDASEAFTGDMVKPLKEILPEFQAIEERVERAVFAQFGVTFPLPKAVKTADLQMLLLEKEDLMGNEDVWSWCEGIEKPVGVSLCYWTPKRAKREFLTRYHMLRAHGFGR